MTFNKGVEGWDIRDIAGNSGIEERKMLNCSFLHDSCLKYFAGYIPVRTWCSVLGIQESKGEG